MNDNQHLSVPSFIDMGLILHSLNDLDSAYEHLKKGGFHRFILLYAGEIDDEMLAHPTYLKRKYPGIIPAFHPLKDGKFHNMELLHTEDWHPRPIFYAHTVYKSLHIAETYQLMLKAHDYNALYISFPHNKKLGAGGVLHRGQKSFKMGLPGFSYLSETAVITRDLELAQSINHPIHFHQISCKRSVDLIRQAKSEGTPVTCGTSAGHLLYTEEQVDGFVHEYKYNPPLRLDEDREALIAGCKDGTIDVISVGHFSPKIDEMGPYIHSPYTAMRPEYIFKTLHEKLVKENIFNLEELVTLLAINPRKILGLKMDDEMLSHPIQQD